VAMAPRRNIGQRRRPSPRRKSTGTRHGSDLGHTPRRKAPARRAGMLPCSVGRGDRDAGGHRSDCYTAPESLEPRHGPCASSAFFGIASPRLAGTSVGGRAAMPAAVGARAQNRRGEAGRPSTLPLLTGRIEAGTLASRRRRTTDVAPPHAARVHRLRMLEKRSKDCHFVPLSGPPGAAPGRRGPLGKPLQHPGIGPDVWAAGPSRNRVA
jgi:hypothetical protein